MRHPRRNEVYRDVGSEPHAPDDPEFVDLHEIRFDPGDALLLCSDGLSDLVDSSAILRRRERARRQSARRGPRLDRRRERGGRQGQRHRRLHRASADRVGRQSCCTTHAPRRRRRRSMLADHHRPRCCCMTGFVVYRAGMVPSLDWLTRVRRVAQSADPDRPAWSNPSPPRSSGRSRDRRDRRGAWRVPRAHHADEKRPSDQPRAPRRDDSAAGDRLRYAARAGRGRHRIGERALVGFRIVGDAQTPLGVGILVEGSGCLDRQRRGLRRRDRRRRLRPRLGRRADRQRYPRQSGRGAGHSGRCPPSHHPQRLQPQRHVTEHARGIHRRTGCGAGVSAERLSRHASRRRSQAWTTADPAQVGARQLVRGRQVRDGHEHRLPSARPLRGHSRDRSRRHGPVVLATDTRTGQNVALKLVPVAPGDEARDDSPGRAGSAPNCSGSSARSARHVPAVYEHLSERVGLLPRRDGVSRRREPLRRDRARRRSRRARGHHRDRAVRVPRSGPQLRGGHRRPEAALAGPRRSQAAERPHHLERQRSRCSTSASPRPCHSAARSRATTSAPGPISHPSGSTATAT